MKYALTTLAFCVISFTQLYAQQSNDNLAFSIGLNAGLLKSPILGIAPQASFGASVAVRPHERISLELAVAHASTRTQASSQALSFIGESKRNFQSTAIDLTAYLKCLSLNKDVAFYVGFGINQLWSDFLQLGRVETGETSFDIVRVYKEHIEGTRTSSIATFALRSNPTARVQVALFGNIGLFASRSERSKLEFITVDRQGNGGGTTFVLGPTRYLRAGVEVSYRIRK